MSGVDPATLDRVRRRRPTSLPAPAPPSLLITLIVLTGAAWALTLHHALGMSMPMGIVVRDGMAAEGLGSMLTSGMAAAGWSLGSAVVFDGGDDAAGGRADDRDLRVGAGPAGARRRSRPGCP